MAQIQSLLCNPFCCQTWNLPGFDIEFMILLMQDSERIIVGTRSAIQEQIRSPYTFVDNHGVLRKHTGEKTTENSNLEKEAAKAVHELVTPGRFARKKIRDAALVSEMMMTQIIHNRVYPLGEFLMTAEYDPTLWPQAVELLLYAAGEKGSRKKKSEQDAISILMRKWETERPDCQYVALRLWQEYLQNGATAKRSMEQLIKPFTVEHRGNPEEPGLTYEEYFLRMPHSLKYEEELAEIWVPAERSVRGICTGQSLFAIKRLYVDVLNSRGRLYKKCSRCGKIFLASSGKQQLCSPKCIELSNKKTKKASNERRSKDPLLVESKNRSMFWTNRINKLKKIPDVPMELREEIEKAFEGYKIERKRQVEIARASDDPVATFRMWAFEQEKLLVEMMGEYEAHLNKKRKTSK